MLQKFTGIKKYFYNFLKNMTMVIKNDLYLYMDDILEKWIWVENAVRFPVCSTYFPLYLLEILLFRPVILRRNYFCIFTLKVEV